LPLISPDKKLWIQYLSTRKGGGVTHYRIEYIEEMQVSSSVEDLYTKKSRSTSSWTWNLKFWRLQNAVVVIARPLEAMKWVIHSILDGGEC
jgi:hypothetical protein